jgi:hypothetical protein
MQKRGRERIKSRLDDDYSDESIWRIARPKTQRSGGLKLLGMQCDIGRTSHTMAPKSFTLLTRYEFAKLVQCVCALSTDSGRLDLVRLVSLTE